jgi:FlaA1/EpsC-like NDP-sugar epimerase
MRHFITKNRRAVVTLIHVIEAFLANYLAFIVRFESILLPEYFDQFLYYLPFILMIRIFFYLQAGLYKNLWRYSSVSDLVKLIYSISLGSIVFLLIVRYLFSDLSYPRSIYVLDWLLLIMISGGDRLIVRVFREYVQSFIPSGKRVLIIGAGDAGEMILRDMRNNPRYGFQPIGFIDDDPYKKGLLIHDVPILGPRGMIKQVIEEQRPEEILLSMPSAGNRDLREVYEICKPYNISLKTLPGLSDIIDGKVSVSQIKPLDLEDLLQRDPVRTDIKTVKDYINGKCVLVTGAGGSIGSELCRQIIRYGPS